MALDKKRLSALVLILLVAIVGIAVLSGVQNAKVGENSLQNVAVQVTDPLSGPSSISALNVTYSSLALDVVAANGSSSWYYYNASGDLDLLKLQNYTYTIAQFGLPLNSSIDGARLTLVGANLSIYGNAGKTFITNSTLYATVNSGRINGTGATILLQLSPSVLPVQNQTGLYFAITPTLSAGAGRSPISFPGSFQPVNATFRARLRAAASSISLISGQITQENDSTSILITVKNEGNSSQRIRPIIIVGNFSSNGISNATALASVLSSVFTVNTIDRVFSTNTLNASNSNSSAISNFTSSLNASELAKIEGSLPAGIRENITAAIGSNAFSGTGFNGTLSGFLGHLNSSAFGSSIASQLHLGSGSSGVNLSSLGGLSGGIGSIINSFRNSSIEASFVSGIIQNQYDQYVAKARVLGEQEQALNAVTLFAEKNGTLVTLSTASQLTPRNWAVLQPGQSMELSFNGTLRSAGNGFFGVASNNTYKIILSGDNTTLNVAAH